MNPRWPTRGLHGDLNGLPTPSFIKSEIYRGFVKASWFCQLGPNYSNTHHLVYNFWYTQGKTTVLYRVILGQNMTKTALFALLTILRKREIKRGSNDFSACSRLWTWTRRTRSWRATSGSTWTGWTIRSSGMLQNTAGSRLEWSSTILYNSLLLTVFFESSSWIISALSSLVFWFSVFF